MKYTEMTSSYNDRRYSRPWIAKVDFKGNSKGTFTFGIWVGQEGHSGMLEIECNPGDIIAKGQKDGRNSRNSAPSYYFVTEQFTLEGIHKVDAYKLHNS